MWQRKQTIYLILVVILLLAMQILPVALLEPVSMGMPKEVYCLRIYDINTGANIYGINTSLIVMAFIDFLLAFLGIFQFKNRKQQMTTCKLGALMSVIWYICLAAVLYMDKEGSIKIQLGGLLPFVCIILFVLAYKGVKHDDDLVRSADRIR